MANRTKRLKNSVESFKAEIEKHFRKLDEDIKEKNELLAGYHIKEIDLSLITALERKIELLGANASDVELIKRYRNRLDEYKKKLGFE